MEKTEYKNILDICSRQDSVREEVFKNHDDNMWWPLKVTDYRKRLLIAGLSTRISYNMIRSYQKVIDNLDEVNLSLALKKIDKNRAVDIEKIAVKKYQDYLLQNLTNNVNQIAKVVNNNKFKVDVKRLEKQLDLIVKNQKEISKKLK